MKLRRILSSVLALSLCMPLLLLPSSGAGTTLNNGDARVFVRSSYGSLSAVYDALELILYTYQESTSYNANCLFNHIMTKELVLIDRNGGPGYVSCANSTLCGDSQNVEYDASSSVSVHSSTATNPKKNLCTLYLVPYSGANPDPVPSSSSITGYIYPANLVTATYMKQSHCVIGFTGPINPDLREIWMEKFLYHSYNKSIADAMSSACAYIYHEAGGTTDANQYIQHMERGNTSFSLGDSDSYPTNQ